MLLGCSGLFCGAVGQAQPRDSLAGERAAQAIKRSIAAEEYDLQWGRARFRTEAGVAVGYTDNLFYSNTDREEDWQINPQVILAGLWPLTQLNTMRFTLGLGYEYYVNNHDLNSAVPLVNPDSELTFHVFAGDFHLRFREQFYYQESLFFNSAPGQSDYYNFHDVAEFKRWDNLAGLNVDWDLNKVVLSASYDNEIFNSSSIDFKYMNRASEWFAGSVNFLLGDQTKAGVESQASITDYCEETVLNDNWRVRAGPFVETKLHYGLSLRGGGGFDTAQYEPVAANSRYSSYYAYGQLRQETRLFTHALTGGRETLLGDNANNLRTTFVRYAIVAPIIRHVDLNADFSVNFAEEFGGSYHEEFTYYVASGKVGYQFHKHWRTDLGYEFVLKDSDVPNYDFHRNQVVWDLIFTF